MLPNPEGIIARASHSLSIRPVRSLDSFVSRYVQSALLIRSFVLGSMRSPIGILRGPPGVRSTDAPLRTECNRKAPLHPSAPLAACGPEFPHLWEREERGGKMWDAGREKVP